MAAERRPSRGQSPEERWLDVLLEEELGGVEAPDLQTATDEVALEPSGVGQRPQRQRSSWLAAALMLCAIAVAVAIAISVKQDPVAPAAPTSEPDIPGLQDPLPPESPPRDLNDLAKALQKLSRMEVQLLVPEMRQGHQPILRAVPDRRLSFHPSEVNTWREAFGELATRSPSQVSSFVLQFDFVCGDRTIRGRGHLVDPALEFGPLVLSPQAELKKLMRQTLARLEHGAPKGSLIHTAKNLAAGTVPVWCRSLVLTEAGSADLAPLAKLKELRDLVIGADRTGNKGVIGDSGLRVLAGLEGLERLVVSRAEPSDDGLRALAGLPALRELRLYCTDDAGFDGSGLAPFGKGGTLETLELFLGRVAKGGAEQRRVVPTAASMLALTELRSLRSLSISRWRRPEKGAALAPTLGRIIYDGSLRELTLHRCEVTLDDVEREIAARHREMGRQKDGRQCLENLTYRFGEVGNLGILRQLPNLRDLNLSECTWNSAREAVANLATTRLRGLALARVTTIGGLVDWKRLMAISSLEHFIWLGNPGVATFAPHLSSLPQLRTLDLSWSDCSDEDLEMLARVQGLSELSLQGCKVSNDAVAQLQRALGKCRIRRPN